MAVMMWAQSLPGVFIRAHIWHGAGSRIGFEFHLLAHAHMSLQLYACMPLPMHKYMHMSLYRHVSAARSLSQHLPLCMNQQLRGCNACLCGCHAAYRNDILSAHMTIFCKRPLIRIASCLTVILSICLSALMYLCWMICMHTCLHACMHG